MSTDHTWYHVDQDTDWLVAEWFGEDWVCDLQEVIALRDRLNQMIEERKKGGK